MTVMTDSICYIVSTTFILMDISKTDNLLALLIMGVINPPSTATATPTSILGKSCTVSLDQVAFDSGKCLKERERVRDKEKETKRLPLKLMLQPSLRDRSVLSLFLSLGERKNGWTQEEVYKPFIIFLLNFNKLSILHSITVYE